MIFKLILFLQLIQNIPINLCPYVLHALIQNEKKQIHRFIGKHPNNLIKNPGHAKDFLGIGLTSDEFYENQTPSQQSRRMSTRFI